jgi:large subunit ribosomal protein L22
MAGQEVKAVHRHARISSQKVQQLIGAVKGKPVETGLNTLRFMPQKGARVLEKILLSAVANADHNLGLDIDDLIIGNITADQGPTLKRFRARARGRGTRILKRSAHITVTLSEKRG